MIMRRFSLLLLICLTAAAHARQITPDEAASIASEFLNLSPSIQKAGKRVNVRRAQAKDAPQSIEENQPYYVFNATDDKGFVIISGDDRAKKILGYSDKGNFDMDNMPPQLAAMLEQYAEQIPKLSGDTPDPSWSAPARRVSASDEGVLLETANWGQGYPYNAQCPIIDGVQCPTGCVATAMAIVMKYHNWPEQGRGKYDPFQDYYIYLPQDHPSLYVVGNTKFDPVIEFNFEGYDFGWDDIPTDVNGIANGNLSSNMLAIGRSVGMIYTQKESGAKTYALGPNCIVFLNIRKIANM